MPQLDFLIGNSTVLVICKFLLFLIIILNLGSAFHRKHNGGTGYIILFLTMLIYCVFYAPNVGDNYASMNSYYSYLNGVDKDDLHFERVYFYIMDLIPFGYVYYRVFLWGGACLLCVWLMKKMGIDSSIASLSVLSFAIPLLLYYQRAAFAYVLLYVALYCFLSQGVLFKSFPLLKRNYKIISIGLLLCALPFHTTMPVYVTVLLFAIFVPKNQLGLGLLLLIMFAFSASVVSNSISILDYFQEDTRETGLLYLENDNNIIDQNFNGWLAYFLRMTPLFCMIIFGLFRMIKSPNHLIEFEKICLINTFILIIMSILFISFSFSIQIKFRNAAMMPWTLFVASYYNRNAGSNTCTTYAIATILASFI